MDNNKIEFFFDNKLSSLKLAAHEGKVVKGLKETIKHIQRKNIESIYIAECDLKEYFKRIVKKYSEAYLDSTIEPFIVSDYKILRDIVLKTKTSDITNINNTKYNLGNKDKGPKCYCTAIIKTKH